MDEGIELARVLGYSRDRGALGYRAFVDILAEVEVCRGLNSLTVVAVVYDVEVRLEDLVLGVLGLELERLDDLAYLTRKAYFVVVGDVLDKLLSHR